MTANKVIERVDALRPNPYSEEQKLGWINNLEEMVQRLVVQSDEISTLSYPEDMDKELIISAPFDNLYQMYLESMIDYYNREYGNYNNSVVMFETRFAEYKKAYIRGNSVTASGHGGGGIAVIKDIEIDKEGNLIATLTNNKVVNIGNIKITEDNISQIVKETTEKVKEQLDGAQTKPVHTYITLIASEWEGDEDPYSQVVYIEGVTKHSKVDLQPSVEQLAIFHDKDLAFVTENEDGVVTVYAIGDRPTKDYTMQATITEVDI